MAIMTRKIVLTPEQVAYTCGMFDAALGYSSDDENKAVNEEIAANYDAGYEFACDFMDEYGYTLADEINEEKTAPREVQDTLDKLIEPDTASDKTLVVVDDLGVI